MATLPAGVGYGVVNWTALQLVIDSPGDPDALPDLLPMTGSVTFTPSITRARIPTVTPPLTLFVQPVTAFLYSDGSLRDPQGNVGVTLLATNSSGLDVAAGAWSWTASFAVSGGAANPVTFQLPMNASLDLTLLSDANVGPGSGTAVTYTYNPDGTVASATDGTVRQTYLYANGRLYDVNWTLV